MDVGNPEVTGRAERNFRIAGKPGLTNCQISSANGLLAFGGPIDKIRKNLFSE
jgi:hypothetical protein